MSQKVRMLDNTFHAGLIRQLNEVAETACIPKKFIEYESAKTWCTQDELFWIKNFHKLKNETHGLVIVGKQPKPIDDKFMAIGAALLRNFIDARMVSVTEIVGSGAQVIDPTVLLVPNFYVKFDNKPMTSWQLHLLHDFLLNRLIRGRKSVLYVEDWKGLTTQYGTSIAEHLEKNFTVLGV